MSNDKDKEKTYGFLGPSYNYVNHIMTPNDFNLKVSGDMWDFGNNVAAIGNYISLLIAGPSNAIKNSDITLPLGNTFMMPTMAKCIDINLNDISYTLVQRSIWINNIPAGNIPLLSSLTNANFSGFRGLIPGIAENMKVLNPFSMMKTLMGGGTPDCQYVTLPIVDSSGVISEQSGYITNIDLSLLDPCSITQIGKYPNGMIRNEKWANWNKNDPAYIPVKVDCGDGYDQEKCSCIEAFQNMNLKNKYENNIFTEENLNEFYIIILGILGLYLLIKIMHKKL